MVTDERVNEDVAVQGIKRLNHRHTTINNRVVTLAEVDSEELARLEARLEAAKAERDEWQANAKELCRESEQFQTERDKARADAERLAERLTAERDLWAEIERLRAALAAHNNAETSE